MPAELDVLRKKVESLSVQVMATIGKEILRRQIEDETLNHLLSDLEDVKNLVLLHGHGVETLAERAKQLNLEPIHPERYHGVYSGPVVACNAYAFLIKIDSEHAIELPIACLTHETIPRFGDFVVMAYQNARLVVAVQTRN